MKICHVVPSLEDRHGGPSKSVRALANAQARVEAAADVQVATTLEAGQMMIPPGDDAAAIHVFSRDWPRFLCRSQGLQRYLAGNEFEVMHSHALWLLTLRYAKAAAGPSCPLVISPRGMMSGWAYEHRRWRKRLAEWLVHPGAFATASGWHATSPDEADDIRRLGFKQPICVAPNGVLIPSAPELAAARAYWHEACPPLVGRRVAVFYSRYHRKKRVRELLDLWLAQPRGDWFLLLVGVPEEDNADSLNARISAAGASDRAAAFDGSSRPAPFAAADLFVLPSHSENFGLVVAEALAAGVPALVTDKTPWKELGPRDAGWCVPWEDWPATLATALAEPPTALSRRGANGRAWTQHAFTWEGSARTLLDFYRTLRR
jgi:glycosyltransferase involved in cell wall biosynthesis